MKKLALIVSLAVSMFVGSQAYAEADPIPEGIATIVDKNEDVVGSGFFLEGGYVVTNYHVIEDRAFLKITDPEGGYYYVHQVAVDTNKDLALLKAIGTSKHPFLKVAETDDGTGEYTAIVSSEEYINKVKTGTYKLSREIKIDMLGKGRSVNGLRDVYTFSSESGNSGGAVMNDEGEVVGVIMGYEYDTGNAVSIQLKDIKTFLSENGGI